MKYTKKEIVQKIGLSVSFIAMLVLLLVSQALAVTYLDTDYPFLHSTSIDVSNFSSLNEEQKTLFGEGIMDPTGNKVSDLTASKFLDDYNLVDSSIDVGLERDKGISLNWEDEQSLTQKCLDITLSNSYFFPHEASIITKTADANSIYDVSFLKEQEYTEVVPEYSTNCMNVSVTYANGTKAINTTCSSSISKTTDVTRHRWNALDLSSSSITSTIREDTLSLSASGNYRYCFSKKYTKGYDSGVTYFQIDGKSYVDLQHSSDWTTTFKYWRNITVVAPSGTQAIVRDTAKVCGWDTATDLSNGKLLANGSGIVMTYLGNQISFNWLNNSAVNASNSQGYLNSNSCLAFAVQANITQGTNDSNYQIYYGNLTYPYNKYYHAMNDIYLMYDDFNRPDNATLGSYDAGTANNTFSWSQTSGSVKIGNNHLSGAASSTGCVNLTSSGNLYVPSLILYVSQNASSSSTNLIYTHLGNSSDTGVNGENRQIANRLQDTGGAIYVTTHATIPKQNTGSIGSQVTPINWTYIYNSSDGEFYTYYNNTRVAWTTTNVTTPGIFKIDKVCYGFEAGVTGSIDYIQFEQQWNPATPNVMGAEQTVTIPPVITSFMVNTTNPFNYTNGSVKANYTTTGIVTSSILTYYINTVMNKTFDNLTIITSTNFTKGTNITAVFAAKNSAGQANASATVIIADAPPEITDLGITSNVATNDTTANLTGSFNYFDIDGDAIVSTATKWYRNGILLSALSNSTQLNSTDTSAQDRIIFSALASTSTLTSSWKNSSTFIVVDSVPTVPNRVPNQNLATYEITYGVNCSGSTDLDVNTINYEFWLGNLTTWAVQQNTTATNYTFTWGANYTALFNCRANDAISAGAFNSTNLSIEFNNSITFGEKSSLVSSTSSGQNATYLFNVSFNGIRVRDLSAVLSLVGVENITATEVNSTDFSNTSVFSVSRFNPFNASSYTNTLFWYITSTDWNGSSRTYRLGSFNQTLTGVTFATGASCPYPSNATLWTIDNLTLRNEENNTQIPANGQIQATYFLWKENEPRSTNFSSSFQVTNINQTYVCISASNDTFNYLGYAKIKYVATGKDTRDYYFINRTFANVTVNTDLYLLDSTLATGVLHTVENPVSDLLANIYIFLDRYDPGTNTYKTVTIGKTDDTGSDLIYLRQNDVEYRYRLYNDTTLIYLSENRKITTTSLFFTIAESSLSNAISAIDGIQSVLTFDNNTGIFSLTYSNAANPVGSNCLRVSKMTILNGTNTLCYNCSIISVNSLTCAVSSSDKGDYFYSYIANTSNGYSEPIQNGEFARGTVTSFAQSLGLNGLFLALIIIGSLGVAAFVIGSPQIAILLVLVGVIMMALTGIFAWSYLGILVLVIGGVIIIGKVKE